MLAHRPCHQPQQRCLSTKRPSMLRRNRQGELAVHSMKVPDYLVPAAYRLDRDGGDRSSNRGGKRGGPNAPHHRRPRANNGASPAHRHRRKASLGQRGNNRRPSQSRSLRDKKAPTVDQLRHLEGQLSRKMADYVRTLSGASLTDLDDLDGRLRETVPLARDLHATERSYEEIAGEFAALIVGWAELAEHACGKKRTEHARLREEGDGIAPPSDGAATVAEYEDAVARAERHLESFEALARNRANVRSKEEERKAEEAKKNKGKRGGILAFFENFFDATPAASADAGGPHSTGVEAPAEAGAEAATTTIDASLYEHVLLANHSAWCFGREAKADATQRSNRLLNRWISLYGASAPDDGADATKDGGEEAEAREGDSLFHAEPLAAACTTERKLFHIVIRQNVDLWTKEGAERAEEWLGRMRDLQTMGKRACAPDVDTYNLVLLGFAHLCKRFHHAPPGRNERRAPSAEQRAGLAYDGASVGREEEGVAREFVLDGAERVLSEMTNWEEEGGVRPNVVSLNLALTALAKAGRKVDATCRRANGLVFDVVGEEKYREMMGSDGGGTPPNAAMGQIEPTLDTYHWLVDIYSASADQVHVKQAVALLRKMILLRQEEEGANQTGNKAASSFAPSTGTHNNVLRALTEKIEAFPADSRLETANAATEFLDTMVQHGSSLPTPITFVFLLQMWQKSKLPEAGEHAETVLARMEVAAMHSEELEAFSNAFVLALECWLTSAMAGTAGAAERAHRLLEVLEAQSGGDRAVSDDVAVRPHRAYYLVLKICAATRRTEDLSQAVNVAFEVYDKMIANDVKPNARSFEYMYMTARNFLDQYPEEERSGLLQRVFEPASKHGITRGELMGRHKQSLRKGYLVA